MSYRKILLTKLKEKGVEIGSTKFDKCYFYWINAVNYKYSKYDGVLNMIENEDLLDDFIEKIKQYEKRT